MATASASVSASAGDVRCEVPLADPDLATDTVQRQFSSFDLPTYGLLANVELDGDFGNGEEARTGRARPQGSVGLHSEPAPPVAGSACGSGGSSLPGSVKLGAALSAPACIHSTAACRANTRTRSTNEST